MRRIVFALMTLLLLTPCRGASRNPVPKGVLDSCGIPWFYTTGNHDWHYEGTEGSEIDLREEWTRKRLLPLYKGYNHECYSVTVKGIKLIFVDNATYLILPSQLKAFSAEIKGKEPKLLFGHIPLQQTAIVDSWTQFTVAANCQGGYFEVVIEPMP